VTTESEAAAILSRFKLIPWSIRIIPLQLHLSSPKNLNNTEVLSLNLWTLILLGIKNKIHRYLYISLIMFDTGASGLIGLGGACCSSAKPTDSCCTTRPQRSYLKEHTVSC
jgi:hypothetical protein